MMGRVSYENGDEVPGLKSFNVQLAFGARANACASALGSPLGFAVPGQSGS